MNIVSVRVAQQRKVEPPVHLLQHVFDFVPRILNQDIAFGNLQIKVVVNPFGSLSFPNSKLTLLFKGFLNHIVQGNTSQTAEFTKKNTSPHQDLKLPQEDFDLPFNMSTTYRRPQRSGRS